MNDKLILLEENRSIENQIGSAVISKYHHRVKGILKKPVNLNLDDGLMTAIMYIEHHNQNHISDVQMDDGGCNIKFRKLREYSHTYMEESQYLNNKLQVTVGNEVFTFYKVSIHRVGSKEKEFRIIAQCSDKELTRFSGLIQKELPNADKGHR